MASSSAPATTHRYVTHGKPALQREEVGFTGESVAERILAALRSPERISS